MEHDPTLHSGPSPEAEDMALALLRPGENVLSIAAISPGIYWKGLAFWVLALIAAFGDVHLAMYFIAVALVFMLVEYGTKHYLLLAATDRRVLVRSGILNKDIVQLHYSQIESLEVFRTFMGGLLGFANVVITGTGSRRIIVPFVENARDFEDIMDQKITERDARMEALPQMRHA
jgi:uncharacterized membrane protein YdbT with pleckstrin-like domain